jgi:hypothetical protein
VDGEEEEEEVVFDVEVTLGEYEAEVAPLVLKAQTLVEAVLDDAAAEAAAAARGEHGTKENDVDGDGDKTAVDAAADADAAAAAAAAAPLSGSSSSSSYHTMMVDEVVLVGGASRTPCLRAMLKSVFPHLKDLCTSSDADTSVAEGLAIRGEQGLIESGCVRERETARSFFFFRNGNVGAGTKTTNQNLFFFAGVRRADDAGLPGV